jgi:hypothetical protein
MTQQINLYDATLLRKRELLTATNLAATAGVLLLIVGGWGAAIRMQLSKVEAESQQLAPAVKRMQEQLVSVGKQVADTKPDPRLEAELEATRERLRTRNEVLAALKKGVGAESPSFAEYLRGFARQAPKGLWLTAFKITDGGALMEIHGRMTDPALLPDYIARLNNEKAFRGRAFAALKIAAGKPEPAPGEASSAGAAPQGSTAPPPGKTAPPFLEFTLIPVRSAPPEPAPVSGDPGKEPQKLADLVPSDAARALEGKR